MHCLYLIFKDWDELPTEEEKNIAAGIKSLDPTHTAEYHVELEKASTSIVNLFTQQHQHAAVCFCNWEVHFTHHHSQRSKLGIRRSLSNSSQIRLLLVTGPSMKLKNLSFGTFLSIPTYGCLYISLTIVPSKNVLWKWVKIQLKE
jgi:hypothetical protein